jgi:hypothetical protein
VEASNPFGAIAWGDKYLMSPYATYTTTPVWTIQSVPTPTVPMGQLSGVSCTSSTTCTAVGSNADPAFGPEVNVGGALERDELVDPVHPQPPGATYGSLTGVSCPSSTACTAVGYDSDYGFAERWNGTSWSIQTTPSPTYSSLYGASCPSSTACQNRVIIATYGPVQPESGSTDASVVPYFAKP